MDQFLLQSGFFPLGLGRFFPTERTGQKATHIAANYKKKENVLLYRFCIIFGVVNTVYLPDRRFFGTAEDFSVFRRPNHSGWSAISDVRCQWFSRRGVSFVSRVS